MRIKFTTAVFFITFLCSSRAEITIEWQKNIGKQLDYGGHTKAWARPNGGAVIVAYHPVTRAGTNSLLLFTAEGSLIYEDTFYGSTNRFINGTLGISANYVTAEMKSIDQDKLLYRIYEIRNGSVFVFNTPPVEARSSLPLYLNPSVFYTFDNEQAILTKYRMSQPPSVLESAIASGIDGSNYILNWQSTEGESYQIQSSTNLTDWINIGVPIVGTGSSLTWANALTNSSSFFRVITN